MTTLSLTEVPLVEPDDRSYRSSMTSADTRWITHIVEREVNAWLAGKNISVDTAADTDVVHRTGNVTARHLSGETHRAVHIVLTERQSEGTWTTEIYASDRDGERSWVHVDIRNSAGRFVSRPRIADALMDSLPLGDGRLKFTAEPQIITARGVPALAELLLDRNRHGLVMLTAAAPDTPLGPLAEMVGKWTREVRGLAQIIVLEQSGTAALARVLGPLHAVAPLTLRTFQPGVDLESPADARRHRVLSTPSLSNLPSGAVRSVLGRAARRQASQRPLPDAVYELRREFQRLAARQIVEQRPQPQPPTARPTTTPPPTPPPPPPPPVIAPEPGVTTERVPPRTVDIRPPRSPELDDASRLVEQLDLVREILHLDTVDRTTLERIAAELARQQDDRDWAILAAHEIETQEASIEKLEDEARQRESTYESLQLDYADSELERVHLLDEMRWLRSRLNEAEDFEGAHGAPPESAFIHYPGSFGELAERLDEFAELNVHYTGDPREVSDLEAYDPLGSMALFTWESLLTLADYRRARFDGATKLGVHDYLKQPPTGYRTVPPKRHASRESEPTMNQYGEARNFPLPGSARKVASMPAHFKLGWVGRITPRLHYLDDYSNSGTMVVGYIGRHLRIASD